MVLLDWNNVTTVASQVKYSVKIICVSFAAIMAIIGAFKVYKRMQLNEFHENPIQEIYYWCAGIIIFILGLVFIYTLF